MPLVSQSEYRAPFLFSNRHVQTVYPTLFRKVPGVDYVRERIDMPDGDFVDLDWSSVGSNRVGIVLHGLEGDSTRAYVAGMVKALNRRRWDAVVFNFRGCSGECNRRVRFYHSGDTEDLHAVVSHVLSKAKYSELAMIGFSIGGNMVLKYLGERERKAASLISKAVALSVPCDLADGAREMDRWFNRLYLKRFLRMLCDKVRMKALIMPESMDGSGCGRLKNFKQFDDRYTAPIHGFASAEDYWEKASCKPCLPAIRTPTLLISAADDPFLPDSCYPVEEARANPKIFLEIPKKGGHVGFVAFNDGGEYWSESRALAFLEEA